MTTDCDHDRADPSAVAAGAAMEGGNSDAGDIAATLRDVTLLCEAVEGLAAAVRSGSQSPLAGTAGARQAAAAPPPPPPPPARYVFRPFAHSSEYKEKRSLARHLADTRAAAALQPYLGRTRLARVAAALDGDAASSPGVRSSRSRSRRGRPVVGGGASLAAYARRLPAAERLPRTLSRAERVVLLHVQRCVRRLRGDGPRRPPQAPHRRPLARLKAAALAVCAAVRASNAAEANVFGFAGSTAGSLRRRRQQQQQQQPGGRSPPHRPRGGGGGGGGGSGDSTISTYRGSVSETPPDVPVPGGGRFFRTHSSFSCASSAVSAWREERRRCEGGGVVGGGGSLDRGGRHPRLHPRAAGGDGGGSGYHTSPPSSPPSSPAGLSRSGRSVPASFDLDMHLSGDTPPMPSGGAGGGGGGFGGSVSSFASGDEQHPRSRRRPQLTRRVLRDESPQHAGSGRRTATATATAATPAVEAEAAEALRCRQQQQQHLAEVRNSCASSSHALAGLLDAFLREAAAAASVRRRRATSSAAQSPARAGGATAASSSSSSSPPPPPAAAAAARLHGEVAGAAAAAETQHVAAVARAVDALRAAAGDAAELDAVARVDGLQARLDTLRRYCAERGISPSRSARRGCGGASASSRTSSLSRSASFTSSQTAAGEAGALLSSSTASSAAGGGGGGGGGGRRGLRSGSGASSSLPSSSADEEDAAGAAAAARLRAEQTARRDLLASMRRIRHGVVRGRGACDFFARATTTTTTSAAARWSDAEEEEDGVVVDPVVRDDGFLGPLHRLCVRPASAAPRTDEDGARGDAPVGARLVRYRYRRRRGGRRRRTDMPDSGSDDGAAADSDGGVSLVTDSSASPAAAVARRARRARREGGRQARPLWRGPKRAAAEGGRRRDAPCGTPALLSGCGGVGPLRFGDEDDGVLEDELYFFLYGKGGSGEPAASPPHLSQRVSRGSVLRAPQATAPSRDCVDASVQCALVCGTEAAARPVSPPPLQEQQRPHGSFAAGGVGSTGVACEDEPLSLGAAPAVPAPPSALPPPSTPGAGTPDPLLPRGLLSPADTKSGAGGVCSDEAAVASVPDVCEEEGHPATASDEAVPSPALCPPGGEGEPSPPSPGAEPAAAAADACSVAAAAAVAVVGVVVAGVLEEGAAGTLSRMRAEQRDILTALKKVYTRGGGSVSPNKSPSDVSEAPSSPLPSPPSALPPRVLADPFEQLEMCIVSLGDVDLSGSDDATSLTDDSFGSSSSVDGRPARILRGSDNSDLEWARAIRSRGHVLGGGGGAVPSATQLVMMTDSTESSCVGDTDGEETHGVSATATFWGGGGGPTEGFCDNDSFSSYGSLSRHSSDASLS